MATTAFRSRMKAMDIESSSVGLRLVPSSFRSSTKRTDFTALQTEESSNVFEQQDGRPIDVDNLPRPPPPTCNSKYRMCFTKSCKALKYIALASLLFSSLVLFCVIFDLSLPFSGSNFILMGTLELSDSVRFFQGDDAIFYWKNLATPQGVMDCEFDFSSILHQGGQGILYRGTCSDDERTDAVVFKYFKGYRPLLWEGSATKVIGEVTDYKFYGSGFNFLVASELQGFEQIGKDIPLSSADDLEYFLLQELIQISRQVRHLNSQFFHLDMWWPNVLYRPAATSTSTATSTANQNNVKESAVAAAGDHRQEWEFQLIDFTLAVPRKLQKYAIWHHLDGARRRTPDVACLLGRKPAGAKEYCNTIPTENLCDGLIDMYPLAVNCLRILHYRREGFDIHGQPWHTPFEAMIEDHENYLSILQAVRESGGVREDLLDMLTQMVDIHSLNRTLVCHD